MSRHDFVCIGTKTAMNKFTLCRLGAVATRALHTKEQRLEDVMNRVLLMIGSV